jgi:membrane protein DedA with SNARE-associated domain
VVFINFSTAMLTHLIQSFGYLGVFVLMTLESALIPIPSEVTMPFAGFLSDQGTLQFWIVVLVGAVGNVMGSLIGYYVGYFIEETVLMRWIRSYGRFILITEEDYTTAASWFTRYGNGIVFFSRLLPAIRTFISLPAGVFRMNLGKFVIYTFAGSLLWSAFLTAIGYYLGSQWASIGPIFSKIQYLIIACVLIGIGYFVYRKVRHIR